MRQIATFGIASAQAGSAPHCGSAPERLKRSLLLRRYCRAAGVELVWQPVFQREERLPPVAAAARLCERAAHLTAALAGSGRPFLCFSGDHASAMGVWGGVMAGLPKSQRLGLIWIDAHMDAHTFQTTPSGNIHGMPVAGLLGQGDRLLASIHGDRPVLCAEQLVLVGVHSYQEPEARLLSDLGVQVIGARGLNSPQRVRRVLSACVGRLLQHCDVLGISIDLDVLEPARVPAVTVPEPGGLQPEVLLGGLAGCGLGERLIGVEIAEYAPRFDRGGRTLHLISQLVSVIYGDCRRLYRSFGSDGLGRSSTSSPIPSSQASS